MKAKLLLLNITLMPSLASCDSLEQRALVPNPSMNSSASESKFTVNLADLQKEIALKEQWQRFFKKRGANVFWNKLQKTADKLEFRLQNLTTKHEEITDEAVAGMLYYLATYKAQQAKKLTLIGNFYRVNKFWTAF